MSKSSVLTPFLQLARVGRFPLGTLFIFWPCAWGATLAAYKVSLPPIELAKDILGLAIASSLIHTTICTLNDICDKEIDAQVERTRKRPLPSGAISMKAAVVFLIAQVAGCLGLVKLWARPDVVPTALIGLFPLHGLYPLMKRVTYWPQVWLGLSASAGLAVAWQHITTGLDGTILGPFTLGVVCWVIHFDSIYACQDRADDIKAGVGSTAVLFGDNIRVFLTAFSSIFVLALAYVGYINQQGFLYFSVAVGSAALHMAWQVATVNFEDKSDCMTKFISNGNMGYFIWAGMLADYVAKVVI